jgi:hypothetical protein
MIRLGKRILLMFRGGEEGQIGSARARLKIFESRDRGKTFTLLSEVNASNLPGDRDIRDPKFVQMGNHALPVRDQPPARLPLSRPRRRGVDRPQRVVRRRPHVDASGEDYADVANGRETSWGFWRYTRRTYKAAGKRKQTLYATGYTDFDTAVGFFASDDGSTWEKRSTIIESYDDVPSEAELQFFGKNAETAVALVRLDNQDILADGQTAICTSHDPFTTWECGRRIEQRLDGPTWVGARRPGTERSFVFARKHLPCTFKRTAIYELRGDLTDPERAHRGLRDPGARELGRHRLHLARAAHQEPLAARLVQQQGRPGAAVVRGHLVAERHLARRGRLQARAQGVHAAAVEQRCPQPPLRRPRRRPTSPVRIS